MWRDMFLLPTPQTYSSVGQRHEEAPDSIQFNLENSYMIGVDCEARRANIFEVFMLLVLQNDLYPQKL